MPVNFFWKKITGSVVFCPLKSRFFDMRYWARYWVPRELNLSPRSPFSRPPLAINANICILHSQNGMPVNSFEKKSREVSYLGILRDWVPRELNLSPMSPVSRLPLAINANICMRRSWYDTCLGLWLLYIHFASCWPIGCKTTGYCSGESQKARKGRVKRLRCEIGSGSYNEG